MKAKINQIINSLMELDSKGYYHVFFEYAGDCLLFTVKIFAGKPQISGKPLYAKTVNPVNREEELEELSGIIDILKAQNIMETTYPCYKRLFIKGKLVGEWHKTTSIIECGSNATNEMLIDGSGYYITDRENHAQYFVDMKQSGETNKQY
jgi:hypothetical protein